jgi:hypothetical protein
MARKVAYVGELAKRSALPAPGSVASFEYGFKGLILLIDHYGDRLPAGGGTDTFMALVMAIAADHVPYFKPRMKPGITSDRVNALRLEREIANAKRPGDRSELAAIRRIARQQRKSVSSLRQQHLRNSKDVIVRILARVQKALPQLPVKDIEKMATDLRHII